MRDGADRRRRRGPAAMIAAARWERVKDLFAAALPLEAEGRAALLARECGGADLLRGEVESLLSAHDGAAGFLDGGTGGAAAGAPAPEAMAGRRLGPYRIVSAIGRGGMGEVYRAVRDDDHFQKVVAVKLVRRGLDDDVVRARFRAERRILARLEHPGIARLLDAGATEEGWPFLVMEHVEGARIDVYADAQRLDTRARLELFRSVCAAVQYAHQNLVVHRDIKPANILVGADGVPKLLDFGVAKLLDPDVAGPATATGFTPMTPAYASPEQVLGQPITTAADVYSLGVVLYELLTGRLPYDLASGQPMELLKAVVEQDPRRASQAGPGPTAPLGGSINVSVLRRQPLTGDLDDILMMALRKEPQRRYGSVEALSEDVRRCLQGLPVAASRGTFGYRARKFVRRNRVPVAAAACVVAALLAGTGATAWQARVARAQRARAERRFADVRHLANAMLFDLYDKVRDLPGSTEARKELVTHALQYLDSLAGEVDGDPGLQRELAAAYRRIGDVQGQSGAANLGDPAAAAANYGKALALYERLALAAPGDIALQTDLVDCQMNVA
ncbi:MAG TPA: serine/threonine-protein kinase, partial [Vicinamibacteria bacterium]|nr:serine/threonine-protein kinase [Vicinamibacteria bacterium]